MNIKEITKYSDDFKSDLSVDSLFYFSVRIDFDFAFSLPDMEESVYYRKNCRVKERLNSNGIYLVFQYRILTQEITEITVKFDCFCLVSYREEEEMKEIVRLLKEYKEAF